MLPLVNQLLFAGHEVARPQDESQLGELTRLETERPVENDPVLLASHCMALNKDEE